ncbi:transposase for IS1272 [Staphylococcus aureus subsp. aureus CIG1267]|nr:transposase for IS1272 [Staphylococcus aureus subsp. aureus CIG1267]
MKAILGFTRMSVRGINKVKRELGFVLMALNIRKIVARRAVYYQIHLKKADFYQIINRNQLFTLPKNLMSQAPLFIQYFVLNGFAFLGCRLSLGLRLALLPQESRH